MVAPVALPVPTFETELPSALRGVDSEDGIPMFEWDCTHELTKIDNPEECFRDFVRLGDPRFTWMEFAVALWRFINRYGVLGVCQHGSESEPRCAACEG